jgi:hypothetical protein
LPRSPEQRRRLVIQNPPPQYPEETSRQRWRINATFAIMAIVLEIVALVLALMFAYIEFPLLQLKDAVTLFNISLAALLLAQCALVLGSQMEYRSFRRGLVLAVCSTIGPLVGVGVVVFSLRAVWLVHDAAALLLYRRTM